MRQALHKAGVRPINNVVDITNYVMLEMGQPMHAFDLDQVRGRKILVRRARDGETIQTLDGKDRELTQNMLVIADAEGATGLAGIVPYNPVGLNAVSLAIASGVVSESFSFLDYVPYNFHSWLLILLFLLSAITGIGRHFEKGTAAAPETPAAEEK